MADLLHEKLTFNIIGAAMEVHTILGGGFLESVYQASLAHELELRKIPFEQQVHLPVFYKEKLMGDFVADFLIDKKVVVEIKAVSRLNESHFAQTLHYVKATNTELGLLINFGGQSLEYRRAANQDFRKRGKDLQKT